MEIDHSEKNEEENSADLIETISEDVIKDDKNENILENTDSMETDEIIPILEKLALKLKMNSLAFLKLLSFQLDESNPDLEEKRWKVLLVHHLNKKVVRACQRSLLGPL